MSCHSMYNLSRLYTMTRPLITKLRNLTGSSSGRALDVCNPLIQHPKQNLYLSLSLNSEDLKVTCSIHVWGIFFGLLLVRVRENHIFRVHKIVDQSVSTGRKVRMPNAFPIDLGVVFVTKERRRTPHLERIAMMFSCECWRMHSIR